jgi:hypothetical protein
MSLQVSNIRPRQTESDAFSATVLLVFDVLGPIQDGDVVTIIAAPRSQASSPGILVAKVELTPSQHFGYAASVTLQSGVPFTIFFCPRAEPDNPDEKIDGQPWETFCVSIQFSTQAPGQSPPTPPAMPAPVIDSSTVRQATLRAGSRVDIHWTSPRAYDAYRVIFFIGSQPGATATINSGGSTGSFGISPAPPGQRFQFTVNGVVIHSFLGIEFSEDVSDASDAVTVIVPPNTRSLRTFLRLSGITLSPGIRSLGPAVAAGVRHLMHL